MFSLGQTQHSRTIPFRAARNTRTDRSRTLIRKGASIGANATILPGLTIGEWSLVGAGAVVTRDVPAEAIVVGNPAKIYGYAGVSKERHPTIGTAPPEPGSAATLVKGATIHRLPRVDDLRGSLSFGETNLQIPFPMKRYFLYSEFRTRRFGARTPIARFTNF
jgi:hypothetical protein